jgi:hypothetical protein
MPERADSTSRTVGVPPLHLMVAGVLGCSGGALALGRGDRFAALPVLASGLAAVVAVAWWQPGRGVAWPRRISLFWLLTFAAFLLFRLPTYPQPDGGQDPGVYYEWAAWQMRHGTVDPCDGLPTRLSPGARARYESLGGFTLPGLTEKDGHPDCFEVEMYPLFAHWLALAGSLAGPAHRNLVLTLFAWMGVLAAVRLADHLAGGSGRAGQLAAVLFAVHPGLAFLAKTPLTETVATSLLLLSLAFLAEAWTRARARSELGWSLGLHAGCFAAYAATRPTAWLLAPFLALAFLGVGLTVQQPGRRRAFLAALGLDTIALAVATVAFAGRLPESLGWVLAGIVDRGLPQRAAVPVALFLLGLSVAGPRSVLRRRILGFLLCGRLFTALTVAALLVGVGQLPDLHRLWEAGSLSRLYPFPAGSGAALRSLAGRSLVYLSPFGAALVVLSLLRPARLLGRDGALLGAAVVGAAAVLLAVQPRSAYSFYYDRYSLSEVIPLALVLVAVAGDRGLRKARSAMTRRGWGVMLALTVLWLLAGSAAQLGRKEGSDPRPYRELRRLHRSGDLLFVERSTIWHDAALISGLRLEADLDVFPVESVAELDDPALRDLIGQGPRTLLLTGRSRAGLKGVPWLGDFVRRRSFFRDSSPHMLERLAAPFSLERQDAGPDLPAWLAGLLPPVRHTVLRETLHLYEWDREAAWSLVFEAEDLPTALPAPGPGTAASTRARVVTAGDPRLVGSGPVAMVYGPYVSLPAGCYLARFRVRSSSESTGPVAILEVATRQGRRVRASRELTPRAIGEAGRYHEVALGFSLAEAAEGVELRVWHLGGSSLAVDRIQLAPCHAPTLPGTRGLPS